MGLIDFEGRASSSFIGGDKADTALGVNPQPQAGLRLPVDDPQATYEAIMRERQAQTPQPATTLGYNPATNEVMSGAGTFSLNNLSTAQAAMDAGHAKRGVANLPAGWSAVAPEDLQNAINQKAADRGFMSAAGETARQIGVGTVQRIPEMVGKTMQWASPDKDSLINQAGQGWRWAGEKAGDAFGGAPMDLLGRGSTASAFIEAGANAPASALGIAGMMVNPALGTALTAGMFGGSQAQDTFEAGMAKGLSYDEARNAGWKTGAIEALGETAADFAGAHLLTKGTQILRSLVAGGRMSTAEAVRIATNPKMLKDFALSTAGNAAIQSGTEYGQAYGQTAVENSYGISDANPHQQGVHGAAVGGAMSAMFMPFGAVASYRNANQRAELGAALNNPDNPVDMLAASQVVSKNITPMVGETEAANWMQGQQGKVDTWMGDRLWNELGTIADQNAQHLGIYPEATDVVDMGGAFNPYLVGQHHGMDEHGQMTPPGLAGLTDAATPQMGLFGGGGDLSMAQVNQTPITFDPVAEAAQMPTAPKQPKPVKQAPPAAVVQPGQVAPSVPVPAPAPKVTVSKQVEGEIAQALAEGKIDQDTHDLLLSGLQQAKKPGRTRTQLEKAVEAARVAAETKKANSHELVTPEGRNKFRAFVEKILGPDVLKLTQLRFGTEGARPEVTADEIAGVRESLLNDWKSKNKGKEPTAADMRKIDEQVVALINPDDTTSEDTRRSIALVARLAGKPKTTVARHLNDALAEIEKLAGLHKFNPADAINTLGWNEETVSDHLDTMSEAEAAQSGLTYRGGVKRGRGVDASSKGDDFDHTAGYDRTEGVAGEVGGTAKEEAAAAKEAEVQNETTTDVVDVVDKAADEVEQTIPANSRDHKNRVITEARAAEAGKDWDSDLQSGDPSWDELSPAHKLAYAKAFIAAEDGAIKARRLLEIFDGITNDHIEARDNAENAPSEPEAAKPVQEEDRSRPQGAGAELEAKVEALKTANPDKSKYIDRAVARFTKGEIDLDRLKAELEQYEPQEEAETVKRSEKLPLESAVDYWKKVVEAWYAGHINKNQIIPMLESSPALMQVLGIKDLPVRTSAHLFDGKYNHGATRAMIENVPNVLAGSPLVWIHVGNGNVPSFNFLYGKRTDKGKQFIVALHPHQDKPGGKTNFVATISEMEEHAILRDLRAGGTVYVGNENAFDGTRNAIQTGKTNNRGISDLRETISRKYNLPGLKRTIATKADLVKLVQEGKAKFSGASKTKKPTTAAKLREDIRGWFFNPARMNALVTVVDTYDQLPANVRKAVGDADDTQAFVYQDHVYMIASNIETGAELGVFLHEMGVHVGMEKLLGTGTFRKLMSQISKWTASKGIEGEIARKAMDRAMAASEASEARGEEEWSPSEVGEELIAYFVEEAVKAGIDPTAIDTKSAVGDWFRTFLAALKVALRKIGLQRFDKLTAKNIVDLAYGAADLELQGAWHGTASDFRNFNHDYMGSGEGAQAFGWGTYLAQGVGIAKGYWKQDVKRKSPRKGHDISFGGKTMSDKEFYTLKNDAERNSDPSDADDLAYRKIFLVNRVYQRVSSGTDLLTAVASVDKQLKQDMKSDASWNEVAEWWKQEKSSIDVQENGKNGPEGSLMRVAANVRDEEYLDWDKPLSEQSALVDKALRASEHFKARNGRFLAEGETGKGLYEHLETVLGSDKKASEYLDSIGIKGIKFLDANSRGSMKNSTLYIDGKEIVPSIRTPMAESSAHVRIIRTGGDVAAALRELEELRDDLINIGDETDAEIDYMKSLLASKVPVEVKTPDQTHNLVIFNDKNIHRVSTQVGASRSSDKIKFSKSIPTVTTTLPELKSATESGFKELSRRVGKSISGALSSGLHKVVFLHDLIDMAKNAGLTEAAGYNTLLGQKAQIRNQIEKKVDRIMQGVTELKDRVAVGKFIEDSTRYQKWGYGPKADNEYSQRFKALSAEGQKVVKEVFDHGEEMYGRIRDLVVAETVREYDNMIARAKNPKRKAELIKEKAKQINRAERALPKMDGPYAPIKRFGDFAVVARSDAYTQAEANNDKAGIRQLLDDPNEIHYVVEFYEDEGTADARARQLNSETSLNAKSFPKQKLYSNTDELPWASINKVKNEIDADPDMTGKEGMKKLLTDIYLQMLAETSARKSELKRKGEHGVAGGNIDMFRSFAQQGRAQAHYVASLSKSGEISRALTEMKGQASGKELNRIYNEIAARYDQSLEYKETPLVDKMMRATSLWMLQLSPAYYLTNLTQTYMVAMPYLGGKYKEKAFTALNKAYKDVSVSIAKSNGDIHIDQLNISDAEKDMLHELRDNGLLDITQAAELGRWADGADTNTTVSKAMQKLNGAMLKVEALNRITTALAAYRLSGERAYAAEIVERTQGNYASDNAPRFFHASGMTKLVTQFRKYQLIQLSLLGRMLHDSFKGSSAEEKAAARRAFLWMMGQTALFTGVKGLPIAPLLMIAGWAFGDDDKDWERNLRKLVGDDSTGLLLSRGLPAWLGVDVSGRIGLGNSTSVLPYTDIEFSKKGYKDILFGLSGASIGGMGGMVMDGIDKLDQGRYYEGVSTMMPGVAKNFFTAMRQAGKGITDGTGASLMSADEIGVMDVFFKTLGIPTTDVSEFQNKRGDIIELSKHFKSRETSVKRKYTDKDMSLAEATAEWKEIQEAKKRWIESMGKRGLRADKIDPALKPSPVVNLIKAPYTREKRESQWEPV
jgi:hypothetical protein